MAARRHPGIQENALVLPSSVSVSSKYMEATLQEGFTFSMPDDVKKMLSDVFRNACKLSQTGQAKGQ